MEIYNYTGIRGLEFIMTCRTPLKKIIKKDGFDGLIKAIKIMDYDSLKGLYYP